MGSVSKQLKWTGTLTRKWQHGPFVQTHCYSVIKHPREKVGVDCQVNIGFFQARHQCFPNFINDCNLSRMLKLHWSIFLATWGQQNKLKTQGNRAIFSPTPLCAGLTVRYRLTAGLILFDSLIPSWWIPGIVPSLCHLCAYDVLWQSVDWLTWSGCAFVFVGTGRTKWGMDHIPLHPYPISDSLRRQSLYGLDHQLRTVTPV